jgi:DNA-binding transcriptional LysR family regulator
VFDAATSTRLFRIAGPALDAVISELTARVNSVAPNVRLEWAPQSQTTYAQVADELIDVGFANAATPLPDGVRDKVLPALKRYVFARKDHPGLNDWSLATWLRWPHIVVALPQASIGDGVERRIANLGLERKVGLRLPNWSTIGPALLRTNMFASQNALVFHHYPDLHALRVREPPIELPGLTFRVFWNARLEADPAQAWLRNIMIGCMEDLIPAASARIEQLA